VFTRPPNQHPKSTFPIISLLCASCMVHNPCWILPPTQSLPIYANRATVDLSLVRERRGDAGATVGSRTMSYLKMVIPVRQGVFVEDE
jgi:hypothetical protein